jgi:sensor histidine kinase YesM
MIIGGYLSFMILHGYIKYKIGSLAHVLSSLIFYLFILFDLISLNLVGNYTLSFINLSKIGFIGVLIANALSLSSRYYKTALRAQNLAVSSHSGTHGPCFSPAL